MKKKKLDLDKLPSSVSNLGINLNVPRFLPKQRLTLVFLGNMEIKAYNVKKHMLQTAHTYPLGPNGNESKLRTLNQWAQFVERVIHVHEPSTPMVVQSSRSGL